MGTSSLPSRKPRLLTFHRLQTLYSRTHSTNMPLVVPGVQSQGGDAIDTWTNKLIGRTLGDDHSETTFAKQDLPKEHRVLQPDSMFTQDHRPNRLNVHVDESGTVKDVRYG